MFMTTSDASNPAADENNDDSGDEEEMKEKENEQSSSSGEPLIELTPFTPLICQRDVSSMEEDSKESNASLEEFSQRLYPNETRKNKISPIRCNSTSPVFSDSLSPSQSPQDHSDNLEDGDKDNSNADSDSNDDDEDMNLQTDSPHLVETKAISPKTMSSKKSEEDDISYKSKMEKWKEENENDEKIYEGASPTRQNGPHSLCDRLLKGELSKSDWSLPRVNYPKDRYITKKIIAN